jgi:Family of unknown function (DUF5455)
MQFFAGLLIAAFGKLFDWLATFVGKKVVMGTAILTTSATLMLAFWIAIKFLMLGVMSTITNTYFLQAFYALWPSNAELCLSAYWTAQVTAFIYREHRDNLRALAWVT